MENHHNNKGKNSIDFVVPVPNNPISNNNGDGDSFESVLDEQRRHNNKGKNSIDFVVPVPNHPISNNNGDDDSFEAVLDEQRREIAEAKTLHSDIDFAYKLQMEEAITASLALHTATPRQNDIVVNNVDYADDGFDYVALLLEDLERLDQERKDREACESLTKEIREDLDRRIHDQKLAAEILNIPDNEWEVYGDNYHKPYEATPSSSSSSNANNSESSFKLYCKGLKSEEMIRDVKVVVGGVGVAICDWKDNVIFEVSKGFDSSQLVGFSHDDDVALEIEALIQGLNSALALDLKRITFFCDHFMLHQYVTGRVQSTQNRIATLVTQLSLLQKKFTDCHPSLVPRNDVKFAFKLARSAIVSQIAWDAGESSSAKGKKETCVICYEDKDVDQMFSVDSCLHRYCFSCMKQHVEVKLLNGLEATCPHEGCKSEVTIENCCQFLDPKLVNIMSQRKREAAIAVTEKVYCPQVRCSALMSKTEILEYTNAYFVGPERSGARKCMKCGIFFCINCRVPWHYNLTCNDYKRYNPHPRAEDAMLDSLARKKLWRRCLKCSHIIELAEGCYHITCRCGYEFCYTCGAPWKNKKATCTCRIWDEHNIIHHRQRR